jgi:NAD(P)-dependent dehydrogenase (short-subunit alcohol dehydrogenase family)
MQDNPIKKTVLITGSTSGMGFASVLKFAREGYITYASTRELDSTQAKELESIAKKENLSINLIYIDLINHKSIEDAVEKIVKECGRIDVLINCAGYGYLSAVEDIDDERFLKQFETNVGGTLKMMQAVIPHMRKQGKGLIINISSIMGFSTAPLNAPYSSSKYALECISETLALEVKPFGIDVVIVQPGDFHTKFLDNAVQQEYTQDSPYLKLYKRKDDKKVEGIGKKDPAIIADLLLEISKSNNPKLRYMVGKEVLIKKLLHTFLIDGLWIKFLRYYYKW